LALSPWINTHEIKKIMKKVFVSLVVFAMMLTVTPVMSNGAHAASAGDLIKMDGNPAVYYLGSDGKRYVFPNGSTYNTWYANFSSVVTVSKSELESYGIGGNVTYRAGTKLIKITTDPKVYAVEPGGVLRWVTTEAIAKELYGNNWNTLIDDVPDPFFVNYTMGSDITSATYPAGTLVKEADSSTVYYVDTDGNKRPIADEAAMTANRFRNEFIRTASSLSGYSAGSSVSGEETELVTTAGPGGSSGSGTSTGSSLTVALSSDTPAAGVVVSNSARNKFTKVDFTAPADGNIVIDSLTIERQGLANDNPLTPILLEGDGVTQIGNSKNLSSTHTATFNEDITVSAGTTKSIYIAANVSTVGTNYAGDMPVFCLKSVSLSGSAATMGTLPVCGNAQTLNGTVTIGTLTVSNGGDNPSATTDKVGKTDKIFSGVQFGTVSNEDIQIEQVRFYQNGTAGDEDVANLEFFVDGVQLGSASHPTNKYVTFDLSASPITIKKGTTKQAYIRGDIVDGSGRTIDFDIYDNIDVIVKGKTYGYYITPTFSQGGTTATSKPYWSGSITTISSGTMSVSKGVLSSINAAEGGTQVALGAFKFNVTGESI